MKILYGVQGTGHGHISRARVVLPRLRDVAEVDVLISGYNFNMKLEGDIAYTARGLSLAYDSRGSIDMLETALNLQPVKFIRDVQSVPVEEYDFVVNDFEPVTAWAAQGAGIPCVAISHQASFLSERVPRPERRSLVAEQIFRHFAPCTAAVGSHYRRYDHFIEPPIIRKAIRDLDPVRGAHITVYLPAFDHQTLCSLFNRVPQADWHVFAPECKEPYQKGNVQVNPIGKDTFLDSIESCRGIISSAGFETTSEAMFLGKKLLVIPIRNQYEQECNAEALREFGAEVVPHITPDFADRVGHWIENGATLSLAETSEEDELISRILEAGTGMEAERPEGRYTEQAV